MIIILCMCICDKYLFTHFNDSISLVKPSGVRVDFLTGVGL